MRKATVLFFGLAIMAMSSAAAAADATALRWNTADVAVNATGVEASAYKLNSVVKSNWATSFTVANEVNWNFVPGHASQAVKNVSVKCGSVTKTIPNFTGTAILTGFSCYSTNQIIIKFDAGAQPDNAVRIGLQAVKLKNGSNLTLKNQASITSFKVVAPSLASTLFIENTSPDGQMVVGMQRLHDVDVYNNAGEEAELVRFVYIVWHTYTDVGTNWVFSKNTGSGFVDMGSAANIFVTESYTYWPYTDWYKYVVVTLNPSEVIDGNGTEYRLSGELYPQFAGATVITELVTDSSPSSPNMGPLTGTGGLFVDVNDLQTRIGSPYTVWNATGEVNTFESGYSIYDQMWDPYDHTALIY